MLTMLGALCAQVVLLAATPEVGVPAAKAPAAQAPTTQAPATKPAAPQAPAMFPVEEQVLAATNAQRARYGLRPLKADGRLLGSARRHCNWMANSGAFQHTSAPVAENIAMGQRSANEVLVSWMNSPGHRANILGRGYTRIGVAAYTRPNGSIYWVQQFE